MFAAYGNSCFTLPASARPGYIRTMRWLFNPIFLLCTSVCTAQANRYDVVIDEIMADPSPSKGLPEAEFVELKNTSARPVNLNGWKISDATGTATINGSFMLQPDSFVIICSTGSRAAFAALGTTLAVGNFPSLDNSGELLSLRSTDGKLIHAVQYSRKWYRNDVKSEGGWTLEMTDTRNACSGAANWQACTGSQGGTPGKKNAADGTNPDQASPVILRSYATDSSIFLLFDEPLDSSGAALAQNYSVSDGIGVPRKVTVLPPLFTEVMLTTNYRLQKNKPYTVSAQQISDCSGNTLKSNTMAKTGIAVLPDPLDLVINELLFNPKPGGADYVEIYNRSYNIIDAKELYIANRSGNNGLSNLRQVSTENRLIFPDDYLVVTDDMRAVQQHYLVKNPAACVEVASMPSYPDDRGTVVLLNSAGVIIEELAYDERWHFKLLDSREGVALERIDYSEPAQDAGNWHSASSSAGYGTPAYRNSQFKAFIQPEKFITIGPETFSPDGDGFDDFTTIYYQFPSPGFVCNITIFHPQGMAVRTLTRNALCGSTGSFRWDGLDEKGHRLSIGVYVVLIELFNLEGKTMKFRKAVTLLRKLN